MISSLSRSPSLSYHPHSQSILLGSVKFSSIGGISTPLHPDTGRPQVFIHDGIPGGVGITEHGYEIIEDLWSATLQVISECPCESGCPGCIYSPKCGNNNESLNKGVAELILRAILGVDGD